ncbi:MAG: rod shape-determining protein MreC [Acidimicrobiia bacterium]|nr:rod shape-determining protein MreC [Acidimicrobiia bacterium]
MLILTSITLITLDTRGGNSGIGGRIRNTARDAFAPIQDGIDSALHPIENWWDGVTRSGDIKDENQRLRRELQQARGAATAGRNARRQIEELSKLASLPFAPTMPGVDAQIILGSPGNFESTVGLNKGSGQGLAPDMPVVSGEGLLGRLARVSRRRSTVLLLTDKDSAVGVRDVRTGDRGVLNGNPDSALQRLDSIDVKALVKAGDELVTVGSAEGPYPPDIPVGRIVAVEHPPGALAARITVRLYADANHTEYVRVLQYPVTP